MGRKLSLFQRSQLTFLAIFLVISTYLRGISIYGTFSSAYLASLTLVAAFFIHLAGKFSHSTNLKLVKPPSEMTFLFVLFIIGSLYSFQASVNATLAVRFFIEMMQVFIIYYVFYAFTIKVHASASVSLFYAYSILALPVLVLLFSAGLDDIALGGFRRLQSFESQATNVNLIATSLVGLIGGCVVLLGNTKGLIKGFLIINALLALPLLIMTGSRKAWLALFIILCILALIGLKSRGFNMSYIKRIRNHLMSVSLGGLFSIFVILLLLQDYVLPLLSRFSLDSVNLATKSRFWTSKVALEQGLHSPLDFVFGGAQDRYHGFRFFNDETLPVTHSIVIDAIVYLGVPFALVFVLFVSRQMYSSFVILFKPSQGCHVSEKVILLLGLSLFLPALAHALTGGGITRELSFWAFFGILSGSYKQVVMSNNQACQSSATSRC